jgi:F0F1-type ATP synthase delta subunit
MKYLGELYKNSEGFQLFTENAGMGIREVRQFNQALQELGDFSPVTLRFIEVLAENKRLMFVSDVAEKYVKLYQQFNKEEKITIISASKLDSNQE